MKVLMLKHYLKYKIEIIKKAPFKGAFFIENKY